MLQLNAKIVLLNLLLLPLLISGSLSNAYYQQGRGNKVASNGKAMRFGLGGRKMGLEDLMLLERLKGRGPCERPSKKTSPSRRKQIPRSLLFKEKHKGAGFVAFNADYKGPRHHPPKNN